MAIEKHTPTSVGSHHAKESPEKDFTHSDRTDRNLPPLESGAIRPGQLRSDHIFPPSMTAPGPAVTDERGLPVLQLDQSAQTTAKFTLSDIIANQQAEQAGQEPPKPDLPPDAVRKAKLMGIVHVDEKERAQLQKEEAERAGQEARERTLHGAGHQQAVGTVHPVAQPHTVAPQHTTASSESVGKSAGESATQAKFDNRGGGATGGEK